MLLYAADLVFRARVCTPSGHLLLPLNRSVSVVPTAFDGEPAWPLKSPIEGHGG